MDDFGAIDRGDGAGKTIRYQDFVIAVDTVAGRHPLQINSGRYIMDLKARYMQDVRGRRLCTPGRLTSFVLHPREIKPTHFRQSLWRPSCHGRLVDYGLFVCEI